MIPNDRPLNQNLHIFENLSDRIANFHLTIVLKIVHFRNTFILRYMFLYERVLILCKKQENTGDYNFKFEFELDGLKIEDDKSKQNRFRSGWKFFENFVKQFILQKNRKNFETHFSLRSKEGRFLSIVLFSKESKMNWVREIKRSIISLQELCWHICSLAPRKIFSIYF